MRKLILFALLVLSVSLGGAEAKAAPCLIGNAGGCAHWSDDNRATPGVVPVYGWAMPANTWQAVAAGRRTWFNASATKIKQGVYTASGTNLCSSPPSTLFVFRNNVCIGAFTGQLCTDSNPLSWAACLTPYYTLDLAGNITNHIVLVMARFRDPGLWANGTPRTLTQADRESLWCHEVNGHGYGMSHTFTPDPIDPGTNSCLYANQQNPGPNTITAPIITQIDGYHTHNDVNNYNGIGTRPMQKPNRKTASVLELIRMSGLGPNGETVYFVPEARSSRGLSPNSIYVRSGGSQQLSIALVLQGAFYSWTLQDG